MRVPLRRDIAGRNPDFRADQRNVRIGAVRSRAELDSTRRGGTGAHRQYLARRDCDPRQNKIPTAGRLVERSHAGNVHFLFRPLLAVCADCIPWDRLLWFGPCSLDALLRVDFYGGASKCGRTSTRRFIRAIQTRLHRWNSHLNTSASADGANVLW